MDINTLGLLLINIVNNSNKILFIDHRVCNRFSTDYLITLPCVTCKQVNRRTTFRKRVRETVVIMMTSLHGSALCIIGHLPVTGHHKGSITQILLLNLLWARPNEFDGDFRRYTVECRYNAIQYCKILHGWLVELRPEYQSVTGSTKDTPSLTLTGELWGVFCEYLWGKWPAPLMWLYCNQRRCCYTSMVPVVWWRNLMRIALYEYALK